MCRGRVTLWTGARPPGSAAAMRMPALVVKRQQLTHTLAQLEGAAGLPHAATHARLPAAIVKRHQLPHLLTHLQGGKLGRRVLPQLCSAPAAPPGCRLPRQACGQPGCLPPAPGARSLASPGWLLPPAAGNCRAGQWSAVDAGSQGEQLPHTEGNCLAASGMLLGASREHNISACRHTALGRLPPERQLMADDVRLQIWSVLQSCTASTSPGLERAGAS